jgi:CPA1 family monovalent cation:H+ antiporter
MLAWGGLRGGLSMVLALALPPNMPERAAVVTTAFGVVILSMLINGLTAAPLLRRLGLASDGRSRDAFERARERLGAVTRALHAIEQLERERPEAPDVVASLRRARLHLLNVEKDRLRRVQREGLAAGIATDDLVADVDRRLLELERPHDACEDEAAL